MPKFLLARQHIIEERYWVEAKDKQEALELAWMGEVDNGPPDETEYIESYSSWDSVYQTDEFLDFMHSKPIVE